MRSSADRSAPVESAEPRKVVLALDYLHLQGLLTVDVLENLQELFRNRKDHGDLYLVAALTGGLRIEQPLTRDPREVLRTLERMEDDITLWNGNFYHQSEFSLFAGIEALLELLGTIPGPKAVVLFSAGSGPGPSYDLEFRSAASLAAISRVSIYPVDSAGLYSSNFT